MPKLTWFMFLVSTSFRNLFRSARRTMISLLAIAAATAAIIVFQSFTDGVQRTFRRNVVTSDFGHFQIFKKGYRDTGDDTPYSYQITNHAQIRAAIEQEVAPLAFLARRQPFFGLLSYNDHSLGGKGLGTDAAEERKFLTLAQVVEGKHLADTGPESLFMGIGLAKKLRAKVGSNVTVLVTTSTGSINAADLELVGTFKTGVTEMDEGLFYVHHEVAERLLRIKGAPKILFGFTDDNELQFQDKLEHVIAEKFPDLEVVHWRKLAAFFDNTMGWILKQMVVFKIIIMLIATISIANVFLMSLLERMGEFGTLRAIGTKRTEILTMIFAESLIQSAMGSILGLGIGIIVIAVFLRDGIVMPPPPLMSVDFLVLPQVPWDSVLPIMALVVLVSGGAGILPALRMARINIVEALGRNV